ncbi:MAG: hypothetical protein GF311_06390 [Candidatus Lokiarchaeota archaeon]|nr:hypothetical protein [Candidatus Lokiarchaeota archaeon]
MTIVIPKILYKNKISGILDEIRSNYGTLARKGYIYGIIAVDQDAKIIAVDSRFDSNLNYWDLSSIGAALYGVARQGQDFFEADSLDRASIIYNNMKLFVKSITDVEIKPGEFREVLVIILSDNEVNIGVMILQMQRFARLMKIEIEKSKSIKSTLRMGEKELKEHIKDLKKEIFGKKLKAID